MCGGNRSIGWEGWIVVLAKGFTFLKATYSRRLLLCFLLTMVASLAGGVLVILHAVWCREDNSRVGIFGVYARCLNIP